MCQFKYLSIFLILILSLSGCWICQFLSTRSLSIDVSGLLSSLTCQFPSIRKTLMLSHTTILLRDEGSRAIITVLITDVSGVAIRSSNAWEWSTVMFALKFSLIKQFYYLTDQKSFTEFCLHVNSRKSRYKIYSFQGWTILTKTVFMFHVSSVCFFVFVCLVF